MIDRVVWESVRWRRGEDSYSLEYERGGLFATLRAPGDRALTLPVAVWEGLIDAVKSARAARARADQQYPARARSRWYDGETSELAEAYKNGRSIAQLARAHSRTEYAIESQLDRMGLISNGQRYGPRPPAGRADAMPGTPDPEPPVEQGGPGTWPGPEGSAGHDGLLK